MTKEIPLTQGKTAIVDDVDFEEINKHRWHFMNTGYAARHRKKTDPPGGRTILMHRAIINGDLSFDVDHINRCKLDNRRSNLRLISRQKNCFNRLKIKGLSKYKGVSVGKAGRFCAGIFIDNKRISLGTYDKEEDAAKAYNIGALKYVGEVALLNDVDHTNFELSIFVPASRYRGVSKVKNNRWLARINVKGKRVSFGSFDSEEDAARMYNFWASDIYGDSAKLNELGRD